MDTEFATAPSHTQGKPWVPKGQLTLVVWPAQSSSLHITLQDVSRGLQTTQLS